MHKNRPANFAGQKRTENSKTHPEKPEKGETGCVLGAGGGSSGWRRMRADGKGRLRAIGHGGTELSRLLARSARGRAPLALAHPSARGFGVDVGERSRERRRARCHPVPAASPRKAGAGLVLRALFGEGLCIDYHFFLRKKSTSARRMAKLTRITAG